MHRVELKDTDPLEADYSASFVFLMHRVELKAPLFDQGRLYCLPVPNAPCGVESASPYWEVIFVDLFLMHRVELKVEFFPTITTTGNGEFLMHRVELKVGFFKQGQGGKRPCS